MHMGDPRTNRVTDALIHGRSLSWLILWCGNILLILGYFGWWFPPFDVLAHLRTQIIGVSLAAGLALALPRYSQAALVIGC